MQSAPVDVQIKWPNDIYSGGLKIGGALIHTSWKGDRFNVLTGIGLNVSNKEPTTCLNDIIAKQQKATRGQDTEVATSREKLLAAIVTNLDRCFKVCCYTQNMGYSVCSVYT